MQQTTEDGGYLLSSETAQELGLVSLHLNQINKNTTSTNSERQTNPKPHAKDKNFNVFWITTPVFSVGWVN